MFSNSLWSKPLGITLILSEFILSLLEANKKIREIIIKCQDDRFGKILLITGKGLHSNSDKDTYVSKKLSKLKFSVPEYIKSQKDLLDRIISIEPAEIKDGGDGAYVINLKKIIV